MFSTIGSVNLEWIRHYDGALGIGDHSVSDSGAVTFLARDPIAIRTYRIVHLEPASDAIGPDETRHAAFTLETIYKAACPTDGDGAYVLTENDVYYMHQEGDVLRRTSLRTHHGEVFLDLKVSGADPRHTAVVLTQDRGSTSYLITCLEAEPGSGIRQVWSKSRSQTVQCIAISSDGSHVAVGHENGAIVLYNRQRRVVWTYEAPHEHPVLSICVDIMGNVVALDATGLKRHHSGDGGIAWRANISANGRAPRNGLPHTMVCSDSQTRMILYASNNMDPESSSIGSYVYLDGLNGDVLWDDAVATGIAGVSISAEAQYSAISCVGGDLLMMSLAPQRGPRPAAAKAETQSAQGIFADAQRAYHKHDFAKAVKLLNKVFVLAPSLYGSGSLYDEAAWHLRETLLTDTKIVSAKSLSRVEAGLELLPYDEKLIIRRNALARLLSEQISHEALLCVEDGLLEDAIAKYTEALSIDPTQTDLRNALRAASDQLAIALLKQADSAFHDDRFDEAIQQLERVQDLRPGEPAIAKRLEHARALRAYATGMQHYIAKNYHEAIYWFRKTLVIFPDHAEANRYLSFAENFSRSEKAPVAASASSVATLDPHVLSDRFAGLD